MMWPQILYLALTMIGLGITLAKHGEERQPYSIWDALLAVATSYPLLWAGGFFAPFQAAQ